MNTVPGLTTLFILHKDLDSMGFNCQTYHKTIHIPEDGYKKNVEMRNYLPLMLVPSYSYFSST